MLPRSELQSQQVRVDDRVADVGELVNVFDRVATAVAVDVVHAYLGGDVQTARTAPSTPARSASTSCPTCQARTRSTHSSPAGARFPASSMRRRSSGSPRIHLLASTRTNADPRWSRGCFSSDRRRLFRDALLVRRLGDSIPLWTPWPRLSTRSVEPS